MLAFSMSIVISGCSICFTKTAKNNQSLEKQIHNTTFSSRLIQAIANNESPEKIEYLITLGDDVNETESEQPYCCNPVLRYALDRGTDPDSVEIIKMLIQAGADVTARTYNRVQDKRVYGFMNLLTYAALYSSVEVVKLLINAGAHDCTPQYISPIGFGKSALTIAKELGNTDIVHELEHVQMKLIK